MTRRDLPGERGMTVMSHETFIRLVREMRRAQVDFFRAKSAEGLEASKRLERQVDAAIRDYFNPQPQLPFEGDKP